MRCYVCPPLKTNKVSGQALRSLNEYVLKELFPTIQDMAIGEVKFTTLFVMSPVASISLLISTNVHHLVFTVEAVGVEVGKAMS